MPFPALCQAHQQHRDQRRKEPLDALYSEHRVLGREQILRDGGQPQADAALLNPMPWLSESGNRIFEDNDVPIRHVLII
jgi:hypothetical protein